MKHRESIKPLGIRFSSSLVWSNPIKNVINKEKSLMVGFKYLRSYLKENQFLKTVANSFFYDATVWYRNDKKSDTKHEDYMHYCLLQTACRNFRNEIELKERRKIASHLIEMINKGKSRGQRFCPDRGLNPSLPVVIAMSYSDP